MRPGADADVVVLGAGAAGMSAALAAAGRGRRVLVVSKGRLGDGATAWAQGGLAAALGPRDSPVAHADDTLAAGAGLCRADRVVELVRAAPALIGWLGGLGARFDGAGAGHPPALTREGGHRRDRIVHAGGDASGAEVARVLARAVRSSPVEVVEDMVALDLLVDPRGGVGGVRLAGVGAAGQLTGAWDLRAGAVVLATGGLGQAYATTTNPASATGDGLALALRAGAAAVDVEFVQFHPTVLWRPAGVGQQALVTEALRGAGAVLVDATGRRVMDGVHPLADLAPRDVVCAGMQARMATAPGGVRDHLFLDATALGPVVLGARFPTVTAACRAAGVDPAREPIPVAPGAHYLCGGVRADLDGRTDVDGLLAVGEVAGTGVHGANRLASNSLTEALLTGRRAGARCADLPAGRQRALLTPAPPWVAVDPSTRASTGAAMSRWAGMPREGTGLAALLDHLGAVTARGAAGVPPRLAAVEAVSLHLVSTLVATAALGRRESRGAHRRT
ncbi:MAG: L-aspartate oxidase, partial [Acidimicrobiales bacterium]